MHRAFFKLAFMLAMTAPLLLGQTPPAPPTAPAPPAKPTAPARPVRSTQVQAFRTDAAGGSYLGIEPRDISPERTAELKLKRAQGVEVTMVDQDSPAGKAGLKEHDVILTFNGTNVESVEQLKRLLRETLPERTVALGISRDGQAQTLNVTLGDRRKLLPGRGDFRGFVVPDVHIPLIEIPEMPSFMVIQSAGRNGTWVEDLSPQLADFLGVKGGHGVLVRSVEKGTPGDAAGLKAGDVIVRVGNDEVSDVGDWRRLIRGKGGQTVQLGVIRDKREQTLSLSVPARRQAGSSSGGGMAFLGPDMEDLQIELESIQPEIAQAKQQAMMELQRALKLQQRDMERARKTAGEQIQHEMRQHQRDMEKLQKDMERLRKELRLEFED